MKFRIKSESGWIEEYTAKNVRAAKIHATKSLVYGCGNMYLINETTGSIFKKKFYNNRNRFDWGNWKEIK